MASNDPAQLVVGDPSSSDLFDQLISESNQLGESENVMPNMSQLGIQCRLCTNEIVLLEDQVALW